MADVAQGLETFGVKEKPMDDEALHIVVGRHPVEALLQTNPELVRELLLANDESVLVSKRFSDMARRHNIKIQRVPKAQLVFLAKGALHQGVAAVLASATYSNFDDIVDAARRAGDNAIVLIADHIQDPNNLGALIRSAAAAGAQGVVIAKDRACQLTPSVFKASAGALPRIKVSRVVNLNQALERLKTEAGLWSLAAAAHGHPAPWDLDLRRPLALVAGSEHKGVSSLLLENCDMAATIPLHDDAESLNVAVAAGVLLFEIKRQRAHMVVELD
jgi:23S rRNA (guanosine2251-2'-O)-methyltransferase